MISHGAVSFLKDRLSMDKYTLHVCHDCGMIATGALDGSFSCLACQRMYNTHPEIGKIVLPYVAKLLCQELTSMSVAPRFCL